MTSPARAWEQYIQRLFVDADPERVLPKHQQGRHDQQAHGRRGGATSAQADNDVPTPQRHPLDTDYAQHVEPHPSHGLLPGDRAAYEDARKAVLEAAAKWWQKDAELVQAQDATHKAYWDRHRDYQSLKKLANAEREAAYAQGGAASEAYQVAARKLREIDEFEGAALERLGDEMNRAYYARQRHQTSYRAAAVKAIKKSLDITGSADGITPFLQGVFSEGSRRKEMERGIKWLRDLLGEHSPVQGQYAAVLETPAQRAFYTKNMINLHRDNGPATLIHEMGHWLEENNAYHVQAQRQRFYDRRTAGDTAQPLAALKPNDGYDAHEYVKPDKFMHPYMGKAYDDARTGKSAHSEVVSMGLEYLYDDPVGLAKKDPDYFHFMMSVVDNLASPYRPRPEKKPKKRPPKQKHLGGQHDQRAHGRRGGGAEGAAQSAPAGVIDHPGGFNLDENTGRVEPGGFFVYEEGRAKGQSIRAEMGEPLPEQGAAAYEDMRQALLKAEGKLEAKLRKLQAEQQALIQKEVTLYHQTQNFLPEGDGPQHADPRYQALKQEYRDTLLQMDINREQRTKVAAEAVATLHKTLFKELDTLSGSSGKAGFALMYEPDSDKRMLSDLKRITKPAEAFIRRALGADGDWDTMEMYVRGKLDTRRAYYDGIVNLGPNDGRKTAVHEMGHWVEDWSPSIQDMRYDFFRYRTDTDMGYAGKPERLADLTGGAYGDAEYTRKDKFIDAYMGKDYSFYDKSREQHITAQATYFSRASEMISMGLEYLYSDPLSLAKRDPEYFHFMMHALYLARKQQRGERQRPNRY